MATFEEIYSENDSTAKLSIGNTTNLGIIVINKNSAIIVPPNSPTLTGKTEKEVGELIQSIVLNGDGSIHVGGGSDDGKIYVYNKLEEQTILLDGENGKLTLGGGDVDGDITIKDDKGHEMIVLNGLRGKITLGGSIIGDESMDGDIEIKNGSGNASIRLLGASASAIFERDNNVESVKIDGQNGNITLGGGLGADGNIIIKNEKGETAINLAGNDAIGIFGGNGLNGDIDIKNGQGTETIKLDGESGNVTLGGEDVDGDLFIKNDKGVNTIILSGNTGDIELLNADFAEDFDIAEEITNDIEPGTVMTLNKEGKLVPCRTDYDDKVVGVIAGAGKYRSGIVMDKNGQQNRLPMSIMGKVYCKVDAGREAIEVGDLITTSKMEGHAMKAMDKNRAFGAVIGKALKPLESGTSLIPVLINLQ